MKNIVAIKLNKEFKKAYYRGKYKAHPILVTYIVKNNLGVNRIGITASKKIGNAVKRNRARRIIRHAYLNIKNDIVFNDSYDIVFVARNKTVDVKTVDVQKTMKYHFDFILNNKGKG